MKKLLAIIIMCFVCCMAYAQKYIVVHQGGNTQQFLLSEVDSISHYGDNSVDLYHNGQKSVRWEMSVLNSFTCQRATALIM